MVKFCPALTVVPAPVVLLFAVEVMLENDVGRIEKRSVEQPMFAPFVTRTRTSRHALTGADGVMVIVALLPFVHTGENDVVSIGMVVTQVVKQPVPAVITPVLSRESSSTTVIGLVLYAALMPVRPAFTATT